MQRKTAYPTDSTYLRKFGLNTRIFKSIKVKKTIKTKLPERYLIIYIKLFAQKYIHILKVFSSIIYNHSHMYTYIPLTTFFFTIRNNFNIIIFLIYLI